MNTNLIEITHDGRKYLINLEKATELGVITEKKNKRPLQIKDVPNGSIFAQGSNKEGRFVMLNNKSRSTGQLVWIIEGCYKGILDAFTTEPGDLSYYNPKTNKWISEIEE